MKVSAAVKNHSVAMNFLKVTWRNSKEAYWTLSTNLTTSTTNMREGSERSKRQKIKDVKQKSSQRGRKRRREKRREWGRRRRVLSVKSQFQLLRCLSRQKTLVTEATRQLLSWKGWWLPDRLIKMANHRPSPARSVLYRPTRIAFRHSNLESWKVKQRRTKMLISMFQTISS